MKPSDARKKENLGTVWYNLYGLQSEKKFGNPNFKIGRSVRIQKCSFNKGYN
jgi:hypothetical protein